MIFSKPKIVFFETTNVCNLKCEMCPHSEGLIENKGYASLALAQKIINELQKLYKNTKKPKIALHLNGEPFMNKNL